MAQLVRRLYHSKRMRTHQSVISRLDNIFKPIEPLFEETSSSSSTGRYSAKRQEEKFTRPLSSVSKYIEGTSLGSPKSAREFRAMVNKKRMAVRFLEQLKPKTRLVSSAIVESELPLATLPEVAVVGRSNSGKSTLINAIVGTRCCAVENKPGSTRRLNFYKVGDPPLIMFCDVPGFGFAYAPESERSQWTEFALWYLKTRRNLRLVIVVADARHGLADSDNELISYLQSNRIEYRIALNKCDLVQKQDLSKRLTLIGKDLSVSDSQLLDKVVPVSALRDQGVDRLRNLVEKCKMKREVIIAGHKRIVTDLLEQRRLKKGQLRADRIARKRAKREDMWGTPPDQGEDNLPTDDDLLDTAAYSPDSTSILKRVDPTQHGDVSVLEFDHFVSADEHANLGLKRGNLPAPTEKADTGYEAAMKLNHSLSWKMKLDLATESPATPQRHQTEPTDSNLTAMGFITTFNPTTVPRGIHKWKVVGQKPVTKTSRSKPRPELHSQIQSDKRRRVSLH